MGSRKHISAEKRKEERKSLYVARLRNVPTSPRKMRIVADLVRGMNVDEALEKLVRKSPRLVHIVLQARYLRRDGRTAEARQLLREGLEDHKQSPGHVRRLNRPWASAAKRLLKETPA